MARGAILSVMCQIECDLEASKLRGLGRLEAFALCWGGPRYKREHDLAQFVVALRYKLEIRR